MHTRCAKVRGSYGVKHHVFLFHFCVVQSGFTECFIFLLNDCKCVNVLYCCLCPLRMLLIATIVV